MSGPELFLDNASTTLGAAYTAGAGSITVASTTSYGTGYGQFPSTLSAGQFFRIKCGTILMKVTAVNSTTNVWTVTVVESTDANQGVNSAVSARLTAGAVASFTQSGYIADADISATAAISTSKLGTGEYVGSDFKASGLTGATATSRYVGATTSGAPTTGTFVLGDYVVDQTGTFWICTTAGSPGTWTRAGGTTYTLPDATTSATGGVEIDVAPASGHPVALTAAGLTPSTATGAPTTGTWVVGELHVDSSHALFVCTVAGTPGTWVQVSGGTTTTIAASGQAALSGAVTLAAGTNVTLTESGQTITIAANGTGGTAVPYAPLTNQNTPDLIFTNAGDVIACPA